MRKLKGIILVVFLVASVLMPFNIYADTLITTSNILGCYVESFSQDYSSSVYHNNIKCFFDGNYEGYASFNMRYDVSGTTYNQQKLVVVSGSSAEFQIDSSPVNINAGSLLSVTSITYNNIKYVSESLSEFRVQYSFPIESYNAVYYAYNQGFEIDSLFQNADYVYPVFISDTSKNAFGYSYSPNMVLTVIFWNGNGNVYNVTSFNNRFTYNGTLVSFNTISAISGGRFIKVVFKNETSASLQLNLKFVDNNVRFIPIFIAQEDVLKYVSTDFALNFGLRNEILDNLQIIAQGTSGSQSSVTDVNSQNQQFESDRDDLIDIEDNFNEDMNDKLDVIDTNTGVSGFGGYFMNSAVWVRTQFDRLTNNTPYGSLIVYGMTLGLALLLLGKVFL